MLNLFWFTALWFKVEDLYGWSVWDLDSSFMSTFLIDDCDFPLWPPGLYLKRDYKKSWLMAAFLRRFDLCTMWLLFLLNKEYKCVLHFIKSGMRYPVLFECNLRSWVHLFTIGDGFGRIYSPYLYMIFLRLESCIKWNLRSEYASFASCVLGEKPCVWDLLVG